MIANLVKGRNFRGCLNYLLSKPDAELIGGNMGGRTPQQLTAEFKFSQRLNPNVRRIVYHVSLSLPKHEYLDDYQWNEIADAYLQGMGFTQNQYLIVRHRDRDHDHIHIVASRVRFDGSCVHDGWDYRRSETLLRQLEQAYNLEAVVPSWEVKKRNLTRNHYQERQKTSEQGTPSLKQQLQQTIDQILPQCRTSQAFLEKLQEAGITTRLRTRRDGVITGISYAHPEITASGTQLGTHYTWRGIEQRLQAQQRQQNAIETQPQAVPEWSQPDPAVTSPAVAPASSVSPVPEPLSSNPGAPPEQPPQQLSPSILVPQQERLAQAIYADTRKLFKRATAEGMKVKSADNTWEIESSRYQIGYTRSRQGTTFSLQAKDGRGELVRMQSTESQAMRVQVAQGLTSQDLTAVQDYDAWPWVFDESQAMARDQQALQRGLVKGHSLEQITEIVQKRSALIAHWQKRDSPAMATAKTIRYLEKLVEAARSVPEPDLDLDAQLQPDLDYEA